MAFSLVNEKEIPEFKTDVGEGKTLILKLEKYCSGESASHWFSTILLLAHPKSAAGPMLAFTIMKTLLNFAFVNGHCSTQWINGCNKS